MEKICSKVDCVDSQKGGHEIYGRADLLTPVPTDRECDHESKFQTKAVTRSDTPSREGASKRSTSFDQEGSSKGAPDVQFQCASRQFQVPLPTYRSVLRVRKSARISKRERSRASLSILDLPESLQVKILSSLPKHEISNALSCCSSWGGGTRRRTPRSSSSRSACQSGLAENVWLAVCQQQVAEDELLRTEKSNREVQTEIAMFPSGNVLDTESEALLDYVYGTHVQDCMSLCDANRGQGGETRFVAEQAVPPRHFWQYLAHRQHWREMARRVGKFRLAPPSSNGSRMCLATIGGDAPEVTYCERAALVGWLLEVGDEFDLPARTMHLAISYVDRALGCAQLGKLLSRASLQLRTRSGTKACLHRNVLQLLGCAALALAWAHHRGSSDVSPRASVDDDAGADGVENEPRQSSQNGGHAVNAGANPEVDAAGVTARQNDGAISGVPPFAFFVELMANAFSAHDVAIMCGMLLFHVLDHERELTLQAILRPRGCMTYDLWNHLATQLSPDRVLHRMANVHGDHCIRQAGYSIAEEVIRRADAAMLCSHRASMQSKLESVLHWPSNAVLRLLLCRLKDADLEQPSRDWLPVFLSAHEWFHGDEEDVTHYAKYILELALVSPLGLKHRHAELAAAAAWLARFVYRWRFQRMPQPSVDPEQFAICAFEALMNCHVSVPARIGCAVDQIKAAMMPPNQLMDGSFANPLLTHGFAGAQCVSPGEAIATIRTLTKIVWDSNFAAGMLDPLDDSSIELSDQPSEASDMARRIVDRISAKYQRPCFRGVSNWAKPYGIDKLLALLAQKQRFAQVQSVGGL